MVTTGLIVRLEARAGKEEDVAAFLRDALPLVQDEPQTVAWFAVWQPESEETLTFTVGSERALDAFYHPFAHLPIAPRIDP